MIFLHLEPGRGCAARIESTTGISPNSKGGIALRLVLCHYAPAQTASGMIQTDNGAISSQSSCMYQRLLPLTH